MIALLLVLAVPPTPLPRLDIDATAVIDLATITVDAAEKHAGRDIMADIPLDVPP